VLFLGAMMISTRWIWAIVVAAVVGVGLPEARAERRIDWSQYLERPGDRPPVSHPVQARSDRAKRHTKSPRVKKHRKHHRARVRAAKRHHRGARRK
jgi:hypothetical protein